MSLQIAAKHLAAKGRGPDTTLVHMTNKEVQGLQALAQKNGGSLSINPDTGLPEAGFLESILPMVAGVGLTAAGMGPMAAALTVGGVSALSTGSLSKGLFAGLGAYGGASLGQQLAVQGMGEAAAANASFGDKLAGMGDASAFSSFENAGNFISANKLPAMAGIAGPLLSSMEDERENDKPSEPVKDTDPGARARSGIKFNPGYMTPTPLPNPYGIEQTYATPYYAAEGGVTYMAEGGMAYGGSTSGPIDTKAQFADYLNKVMNPTNRTNAVSGSTNPYEWWKSPSTPEAAPAAPPAETAEEYAARMRVNARGGGGGPSAEEREAQLNEVNDYLSTPENPITMNQYWAMSSKDRAALDAAAAERNPIRGAIKTGVETLGVPMAYRVFESLKNKFTGPDTNDPKSVGMVFPTENDRIKAEEVAKYRQALLGDTSPYADTGTSGIDRVITEDARNAAVQRAADEAANLARMQFDTFSRQEGDIPPALSRQERDVPDAVAQTNAVLSRQMNDIPAALSRQERDVPPAVAPTTDPFAAVSRQEMDVPEALSRQERDVPDAVAQTNAALGYPFQPNAIQNALANLALPSESNKIVNKYLADNANIAPTQYEGIVSAADLGSQFPGPPATNTDAPQSEAEARALSLANQTDDEGFKSFFGYYPDASLSDIAKQTNPMSLDPAQKAYIASKLIENNPALSEQEGRLQKLLNQTDDEGFKSFFGYDRVLGEQPTTEKDTPHTPVQGAYLPDIQGINEISADPNADNYAQILKAFDPDNADVAGLLSEPGFRLAAGADYTGGIPDGSTFAGIPAPNMGYYSDNQGGRGLGISGLGSVLRSADGTPVRTGDGFSVQTGAGAQQESSSDRVDRIIREAQQAVINSTDFSGMDRGRLQGEGAAPIGGGAPPSGVSSGAGAFPGGGGAPPSGAPAPSAPSNPGDSGRGGGGAHAGGNGGEGGGYGAVAPGYTGGSEAAAGGLSTPYGFQHMAQGGISDPYNLGSYSDGGRLLRGPGDGVSDSIPATIGKGRPARLADGEFVIPARIVSEIGNGSTEAGARKLYAMMDRIQASRRNTVGKGKVAVNNRADKYLPR